VIKMINEISVAIIFITFAWVLKKTPSAEEKKNA